MLRMIGSAGSCGEGPDRSAAPPQSWRPDKLPFKQTLTHQPVATVSVSPRQASADSSHSALSPLGSISFSFILVLLIHLWLFLFCYVSLCCHGLFHSFAVLIENTLK